MDINIKNIQSIADHDITDIEQLDMGRIKIIIDNGTEMIIAVLSMSSLEERISEINKTVSELQTTIADMETKKSELEAMVTPPLETIEITTATEVADIIEETPPTDTTPPI